MITKEQFIDAINLIESQGKIFDTLYDLKCEMYDTDIYGNFSELSDILWKSHFDELGDELINTWLHDLFTKELLPICLDRDKVTEIYVKTPEELWDLVKDFQHA